MGGTACPVIRAGQCLCLWREASLAPAPEDVMPLRAEYRGGFLRETVGALLGGAMDRGYPRRCRAT